MVGGGPVKEEDLPGKKKKGVKRGINKEKPRLRLFGESHTWKESVTERRKNVKRGEK